jgi:hypothetical protein
MARYGVQQGAQAADALLWSKVRYEICMFVQHRAPLEVLCNLCKSYFLQEELQQLQQRGVSLRHPRQALQW